MITNVSILIILIIVVIAAVLVVVILNKKYTGGTINDDIIEQLKIPNIDILSDDDINNYIEHHISEVSQELNPLTKIHNILNSNNISLDKSDIQIKLIYTNKRIQYYITNSDGNNPQFYIFDLNDIYKAVQYIINLIEIPTYNNVQIDDVLVKGIGANGIVIACDINGNQRAVKIYLKTKFTDVELQCFGIRSNIINNDVNIKQFEHMIKLCGVVPCQPILCSKMCKFCMSVVESNTIEGKWLDTVRVNLNSDSNHWHLEMDIMNDTLENLFKTYLGIPYLKLRLQLVLQILRHLACAASKDLIYTDMKAENCLYKIDSNLGFKVFVGDIGGFCKTQLVNIKNTKYSYKNILHNQSFQTQNRLYSPCTHITNQFAAVVLLLEALQRTNILKLILSNNVQKLKNSINTMENIRIPMSNDVIKLIKDIWTTNERPELYSDSSSDSYMTAIANRLETIINTSQDIPTVLPKRADILDPSNGIVSQPVIYPNIPKYTRQTQNKCIIM
jgi:hypothetical protein